MKHILRVARTALSLVFIVPGLCTPASPWVSVAAPVQEQAAMVVGWVDEAQQAATRAGSDAQQLDAAASKASVSMGAVLAKVGSAKMAMDQAIANQGKLAALKNEMWKKAKEAARGEIPKMLPKLRKIAGERAEKKAKQKAQLFGKRMKVKARLESAKAAKVYTDVLTGAGKTAADYAKVGDQLISQSASMQMNAGLAQSQAGQYISVGDMNEAQKLMQQSRSDMNMALGLNAQATGMYSQANRITSQLPTYANQAAMAAYHTQALYDPAVQAPPPPLVLAQQHVYPKGGASLLSRTRRI